MSLLPANTLRRRRSSNPNFSAGVFREKRQAGQEKRLGGCRLLTPHAPSGVRTQPAVDNTITRACVLYMAALTESKCQRAQLAQKTCSLRFAVIKLRLQMTDTLKRVRIPTTRRLISDQVLRGSLELAP